MPFCRFSLKANKPLSNQYPKALLTVGDHLRKKRLDIGLLQREVALLLGCTDASVVRWEMNENTPTLLYLPAIVKFLGYCPIDPRDTAGQRLVWARQCNGLSQSRMAQAIGVDPNTLWRLEDGKWDGRRKNLMKAIGFLEAEAARRAGEEG